MKKLIVSAIVCAAIANVAVADTPEEREARHQAKVEELNRRNAEREAKRQQEIKAFEAGARELKDREEAERAGMELDAYRMKRDTDLAARAEVSLEEWRGMDDTQRNRRMIEVGARKQLERDTAEAEKAGLSLDDYRLQQEAKRANCTLEEWKGLDAAARKEKMRAAIEAHNLMMDTKAAEKKGMTVEEYRAAREKRRAAREAKRLEDLKALKARIRGEAQ